MQRETFGSFYDQKQNYSIQFASLDDCNKFVMHIALAKHIVSGAEFTSHDIAAGSGQVACNPVQPLLRADANLRSTGPVAG